MVTESIFIFLNEDRIFKNVYETCLDFEKTIANEIYKAALNRSRVVIEELIEIIIKKDKQDKKLSKEVYGKYTPLSAILDKCERKKYIDIGFYHKLSKFVMQYGNKASHKTKKKFTIDDVKYAHKLIFDFSIDVFKRFESRFEKEYYFDLSYLDKNKNFTKKEADEILKNHHVNDVSTDEIIKELESKEIFLSKQQFEKLIQPITNDVSNIVNVDFITQDNLDSVLSNYDESLREDILKIVENSKNKQFNEISKTINNIEENQISISEINDLIDKNNDEMKNDILLSIKEIAGELIKSELESIIKEFQSTPLIEDNQIIEAPNYEVVETGDLFEIKEIEEILGIPDKCPKCDTILKKGSTKCHSCGYDLFDELNKRCPKCGKRIPFGSKFCIRCGNDLDKWKCDKCGYENKKDTKFCVKCGNKL